VSVEIVRSDDLPAPQWRSDGVWITSDEESPGDGLRVIEAKAPVTGDRGFMRLRVRHEE
jgi:hypothetical protein